MARPDLSKITQDVEQVYEQGRLTGRAEAEQQFFGNAAATLTAGLFMASLGTAAQMIREHSPEAATFFEHKSKEFKEFLTPAKVRAVEPADGATGVVLDNDVSVRFTSAIDPSTLTEETFAIAPASGGAPLASTLVWDEETLTATLTPSNGLSPGVLYKAKVSATVKAKGGQPMGNDYVWVFETKAGE